MKLRLLSLGMVALFWCSSAFAATVDFVQITDPHIFDDKKTEDSEGNRDALRWAIEEINKCQGKPADYKFVVVTGDLGLEGLFPKDEAGRNAAAQDLAGILKASVVKEWLFLPGNNDLQGEDPETIALFHDFTHAVGAKLPEMKIVNFYPQDGDSSSGVRNEGGCRFLGFNNASFKSNDFADDAKRFAGSQLKNVQEVKIRLSAPGLKHAFIFYHIPEIDDPYAAFEPRTQEDRNNLEKRARKRGEVGKDFPYSAWTVIRDVRDQWNAVVQEDVVKGLFAGHFHSFHREAYEGFNWIHGANYFSGSLTKLMVCPPLASKKQETEKVQARGFRTFSIDCDRGTFESQVHWYEKDRGAEPILAQKEIVLSVDAATNSASGLIYLSNPREKEIAISLSAGDFKSSLAGHGLNTKTVFAAPLATTGQPVYETRIAPRTTATVKVDVTNFWEAGEAAAELYNYGQSIGTLRGVKSRPRFSVKIVAPTPDNPELTFVKGKPTQIALNNEDAMTYLVAVSATVNGISSPASETRLTPNGSHSVELKPPDHWFSFSSVFKSEVREGRLQLQWRSPEGGPEAEAERVLPCRAILKTGGDLRHALCGYVLLFLLVTAGGVSSMVLSNWVPNRLARAEIDEDLSDLARATTALSQRIDSGLRVLLRVERNRLHRLVRSEFILSANYPNIVKKAREQMAVLTQQVELAGEIDRARQRLEPVIQANPIPFKIERIDLDLQSAANRLRRLSCTNADIEAAKGFIKTATDRIDKMTAPDDELVAELKSRIERLNDYVKATTPNGTPNPAFDELKKAFPNVFTRFGKFTAENVQPGEYSPVDLVTAQLQAIREYQEYYDAGIEPPPPFPRAQESTQHFGLRTFEGFRRARRFLNELREGIPPETIEEALKNRQAEILITPPPVEHQPAQFTIRFRSEFLDPASAREEFRCEWDFDDNTLKETGWEVYHYFREAKDYTVTATFFRKNAAAPAQTSALPNLNLQKPLKVSKPAPNPSADRNVAEFVRLGIALFIALIGLLAGAREQLTKLDFVPAAVAVFLLGFGADTIKNLIGPKQTESNSR